MSNPVPDPSEVIHIPRGEIDIVAGTILSTRQVSDLEIVGFSPAFPEKLRHLNDALSTGILASPRSLMGFRFRLTPDSDRPGIEITEKRSHPYEVTVDAAAGRKTAVFEVRDKAGYVSGNDEPDGNIATVRLGTLQEFAVQYPTNATVLFKVKPHPDVELVEGANPVTELPLADIHSVDQLNEEMGVSPATYMRLVDLAIGFEYEEVLEPGTRPVQEKLWIPLGFQSVFNSGPRAIERFHGEPVFTLKELRAEGPSASIEQVIGLFAMLVDTPLEPVDHNAT